MDVLFVWYDVFLLERSEMSRGQRWFSRLTVAVDLRRTRTV